MYQITGINAKSKFSIKYSSESWQLVGAAVVKLRNKVTGLA